MLFYFFRGRNGRAGIDQIGRISAVLFMETVFHKKVRKKLCVCRNRSGLFRPIFFLPAADTGRPGAEEVRRFLPCL